MTTSLASPDLRLSRDLAYRRDQPREVMIAVGGGQLVRLFVVLLTGHHDTGTLWSTRAAWVARVFCGIFCRPDGEV